jgi:phage baseplate assembly protein W
MALSKRPVYQYQPINENPDVAIGIPLPFNKASRARTDYFRSATFGDGNNYASGSSAGGQVFGQTFSTEEQAISNLKNLLLTIKGERYMQPRFGTRIREILFDNNTQDVRDLLRQTLNEDIKYWLPYINIQNVELVSSVDMHAIAIRVFFQVTTVGSEMVINIMATENEFVVTDAEPAGTALVDVGTVGQGSAFDLGAAAAGFVGGGY